MSNFGLVIIFISLDVFGYQLGPFAVFCFWIVCFDVEIMAFHWLPTWKTDPLAPSFLLLHFIV